ncbi:MAG: hypothetical protein ABIY52_07075 [Gemmatimonadaceae bacterium]
MDRRLFAVSLLVAAACSGGEGKARADSASVVTKDSAGGSVSASSPATDAAKVTDSASAGGGGGGGAANPQGRIPVLEYHVIGGDKNTLYTRTAASYRADLEAAYKMGYRPINIAQMLDKNFSDVPAGMSPVVFVFDDASDSQFRYTESGGKLEVDPTSAVGIWLDFAKSHPGWKNRAVFCMLNGGAAGHNFFGDNPKFGGQKKEWRFQKVKWLADQGFELCSHTLWHAKLSQYPDAVVQ